jgi:hypothetical protein
MLSEIFILRLEAILRANALTASTIDTRFVPIKPPVRPTKDLQRKASRINRSGDAEQPQ